MISEQDVKKIASLSRIHLRDDEVEPLRKDLGSILDYVTKLEKLDVTDIKPTSHALPLENVHREDKTHKSLDQSQALKISVEQEQGSFKVPKVIE